LSALPVWTNWSDPLVARGYAKVMPTAPLLRMFAGPQPCRFEGVMVTAWTATGTTSKVLQHSAVTPGHR
jgi:hypothetical protein